FGNEPGVADRAGTGRGGPGGAAEGGGGGTRPPSYAPAPRGTLQALGSSEPDYSGVMGIPQPNATPDELAIWNYLYG
ncbi:MAG: hypothetical protein ACXADB_10685, partial [Candidatus Hermodarchaeia archaeon]